MKTFFCALFFSAFLSGLYGQSKADSLKFNNRLYKREIGIGLNGALNGGLGNALVLKIRDDRSKLVPVTYSKYWRFQANWYLNQYSGFSDRFEGENFNYEHFNLPNRNMNLGLSLGRERNNFYGRFNFYYGWDVNLGWRNNNYVKAQIYTSGANQDQFISYLRKEHSFSARNYNFVGVKYHFSDRISVSIESAFFIGYVFTQGQTIAYETYGDLTKGNKWAQHEVEYGIQYLRFATLNYHFRRY